LQRQVQERTGRAGTAEAGKAALEGRLADPTARAAAELDAAEADRADLLEQVRQLQVAGTENDRLASRVEELEQQLQVAATGGAGLTEQVEELERERAQLAGQVSELTARVVQGEAQAGGASMELQERIAGLQDEVAERDSQLAGLLQEQAAQAAQLEQLQAFETALEEQLEAARQAGESLAAERDAALERVSMLDGELLQVSEALTLAQQEAAAGADDVSELAAQVEELGGQLAALQAGRDAAVAEAGQLQEALQAGQQQIDSLIQGRDQLEERVAEAAARNSELLARNAALESELAGLEEQVASLSAERDGLLDENRELEAEIEAARSRIADLSDQYESLRTDAVRLSEEQISQRDSLRLELEATQGELARLMGARGVYTVQPGDSLSSISAYFYRNGNQWPEVLGANSQLIGNNPDLIYSGMVLIIPALP
jgi:chromosome segregation ATPase